MVGFKQKDNRWGKAEISNKVIENHKMNQLESRYVKTSSRSVM